MPAYQTTPFKPTPQLLIPGKSEYVFGSWNDRTSPTIGYIITDAGVTTTATLVFQIVSGNAPIVGAKVTVRGAANSANFNVTNATILTVTTDVNTGICTITYAITSTSQGTTADHGEVEVPQPEIGEALSSNLVSVPVAESYNSGIVNQGRTVTAVVTFPSAPTGGTVFLQGAMFDIDAQYQDIGAVTTVGASPQVGPGADFPDLAFKFYRLRVGTITGGASPTIVGKIS